LPDDISPGEITRRLDRLDGRLDGFENLLRETGLRVVSQEVFSQYQRDTDRRFEAGERDHEQEVADRKAADQELKAGLERQGTSWRTNFWQTVVAALALVGIAVNVWTATRGR
jgi:hypothetical protein